MSFEATDFLAGLFGDQPPAAGGPDEAPTIDPLGPDGWPAKTVDPGDPCPDCGSLEVWWDLLGERHCQQCEAEKLDRGRRLANRAARLRRTGRRDAGGSGPENCPTLQGKGSGRPFTP